MFKLIRKELTWAGRPFVFESGRMARQADGAVLVSHGENRSAVHGGGAEDA